MNAPQTPFLRETAAVDEAAVQPFPNSRKVYVQGSRADVCVPLREISQSDTPTNFGGEKIHLSMYTTLLAFIPIHTLKSTFDGVYRLYVPPGLKSAKTVKC